LLNVEENDANPHYNYTGSKYALGSAGGILGGISGTDRNNSSFDHNLDEARARIFSEERQSSFLPRLDAAQRQTNS